MVLVLVDRRVFLLAVDFGVTDLICSSVIFGLKDFGAGKFFGFSSAMGCDEKNEL